MMKNVKILKRPTSTPPQTPSVRVERELTQLLESALQRERARLEASYRQRQDMLLRAVSDVLNNTLERVVTAAARREIETLMQAFLSLQESAPKPVVSEEEVALAKQHFISAFERTALPQFERSIATMLTSLSKNVEQVLDDKLLSPCASVVTSLEGTADKIRSAKSVVADMSLDEESADLAAVQAALDAGKIKEALTLCTGKSIKVKAKAVSGVLDSSVRAEDAMAGAVPPMVDLINFAAVLSMDLTDRTEARLAWLYEIISLMDDTESGNEADMESIRRKLVGTIERLSEFQKNGTPAPAEAKHAKLLIRVLKAHLNGMST
ncbi:unnamed protein product [Agarophyton chilense]